MSGFKKLVDRILTSKYNKPFPVTLLPSAIGYYLGVQSGKKQAETLAEFRKVHEENQAMLKEISWKQK
ncbi:hypothetical protein CB0940_07707 [Cercospora beticola]|uniref:Uncharacterized protein n=1 Tax=Cercospora beticola TaxID=122368 RepID=A0A2G5HA24_CERBT|nr:hypothetical protein CB0940_07707 [Cercospora beticola]PIA89379.1 hypothetical protein CB0940_07707 [Cercospora beticola]WPB03674.1 hypothetical protein RHO25_008315 [Cercospora beticola]CAK1357570.1 unnamed protein product [Cercospora beticola]